MGHESISVRDEQAPAAHGDILFLGSPVRFGSTTKRVKHFVQKLDGAVWKDKPVVVFTTILALPDNPTDKRKESREKYDMAAGRKLAELARSQGLSVLEAQLWVDVLEARGLTTVT